MKKLFISTSTFAEYDSAPLKTAKKMGYTVEVNPHGRKLEAEELLELAKGTVGLLAGTEKISAETIEKLDDLKVISRCGVGVSNVDINAAESRGIKIFNTPDAPTQAVAELTLALMLDCLRCVSLTDRMIRGGEWKKTMGALLSGKTVGILGYGRIGRAVSSLVKVFGAKVKAYDINDSVIETKIRSTFEEVIKSSDILTIHIPFSDEYHHIISSDVINNMPKGSGIINVSRGGLIDEEALYEALVSGHLSFAGIDVFEEEPYRGRLAGLDSTVLTSHIGSYAKESRILMEKQAMDNLLNGLACAKKGNI